MGNLTGTSTAEIDAPVARVWELVEDVEHAPDWQGGLKGIFPIERDAEAGRRCASRIRTARSGRSSRPCGSSTTARPG